MTACAAFSEIANPGQAIGFSWLGLLFLVLLTVPNVVWAVRDGGKFEKEAGEEPGWLTWFERAGQVLTIVGLLFTRNLVWHPGAPDAWWLAAAAVLMALYEVFWIRYFRGDRSVQSFYRALAGVPVPGALLPVAAALCLAACARSVFLGLSVIVLGIGHVGIHAIHALRSRRM